MDWFVIVKWAEAILFVGGMVLAAYLIAVTLNRGDRRRGR